MNRHDVLEWLRVQREAIPPDFITDGCSNAPDRLFGRDLAGACCVHDLWYCTRAWKAGKLTQQHREQADMMLGRCIRALLPLGVGWIGWLYYRAVHRFGGDEAFDSCGKEAGERCRHGLPPPRWMARR